MSDFARLEPVGGTIPFGLEGVMAPDVRDMGNGRVMIRLGSLAIHGEADEVQATVAAIARQLADVVGWCPPSTVPVGDLDGDVVGCQIRTSVYKLSDGVTTWGPWGEVVEYRHDPIGWGRRLVLADGTALELADPDACVQVRYRTADLEAVA